MSVLLKQGRASRQGTNSFMAIGWGKSFEEQVEEANQRASRERVPRISVEERICQSRLHSLKLSRSRIEQQLAKAVNPAHRAMLMKALQALEKELEGLSFQAPKKKDNHR